MIYFRFIPVEVPSGKLKNKKPEKKKGCCWLAIKCILKYNLIYIFKVSEMKLVIGISKSSEVAKEVAVNVTWLKSSVKIEK